jgi:anthranilate phosphoribosyltransferase
VEVSALLSAFNLRPVTSDELLGFREAMLERALRIDLSAFDPMDIVGTGGDGKNTFNISTLSAFVAVGAGVKVAKHGNYGISSVSGASTVLELMGAVFTNDPHIIRKQIEVCGFTFLHAPLFHPAMKSVAHVRKALGIRTVFNLLGPLSNPADPSCFLLGAYNRDTAGLYASVLQKANKRYAVVHALDGYDEISLTGSSFVLTPDKAQVVEPEDWGFSRIFPGDIDGGKTPEAAKQIFLNIIQGLGTDQQNAVVIANAGLAISVYKGIAVEDGIAEARVSLDSGSAYKILQQYISLQP